MKNKSYHIIISFLSITLLTFFSYYIVSHLIVATIDAGKKSPYIINMSKDITIDLIAEGLLSPTSMAFVDYNTIMVLEKDTGNVRLISDGQLKEEPILEVNVENKAEQGLLGISIQRNDDDTSVISTANNYGENTTIASSNEPSSTFLGYSVFLFYTEKINQFEGNNTGNIRNRIYEYTWDGQSLLNPKLVLDFPTGPIGYHNGGKLKMGPDNKLFAVVGDLATVNNTLQNFDDGTSYIKEPNNSSVIVRIDPLTRSYPEDNPFYRHYQNNDSHRALAYYFAYGIRNSFGIDFDPVTGKLWDTENGEERYDEINLVEPGFNSGWYKLVGPTSRNNNSIADLVVFNGSHYSNPIFTWYFPIGITDIEFYKSQKLGKEFENNIFVGDINTGNLYFFKLNSSRTGINIDKCNEEILDLVADNLTESEKFIFAEGFDGRISDIETGSDGNLYILTYFDGKIFKIS